MSIVFTIVFGHVLHSHLSTRLINRFSKVIRKHRVSRLLLEYVLTPSHIWRVKAFLKTHLTRIWSYVTAAYKCVHHSHGLKLYEGLLSNLLLGRSTDDTTIVSAILVVVPPGLLLMLDLNSVNRFLGAFTIHNVAP